MQQMPLHDDPRACGARPAARATPGLAPGPVLWPLGPIRLSSTVGRPPSPCPTTWRRNGCAGRRGRHCTCAQPAGPQGGRGRAGDVPSPQAPLPNSPSPPPLSSCNYLQPRRSPSSTRSTGSRHTRQEGPSVSAASCPIEPWRSWGKLASAYGRKPRPEAHWPKAARRPRSPSGSAAAVGAGKDRSRSSAVAECRRGLMGQVISKFVRLRIGCAAAASGSIIP